MHTGIRKWSRLKQKSPVPTTKHQLSVLTPLVEPIKAFKLIHLRRELLRKVRGDNQVACGGRVSSSAKNAAHEADINAAFRARNLDLLNAYQQFSPDGSNIRIVTVAFLAYANLPRANRVETFNDAHVSKAKAVAQTFIHYAERTAYGNVNSIISTTAALFRYPERTKDILMMLRQNNFPTGDITPLVDDLIYGGVLKFAA